MYHSFRKIPGSSHPTETIDLIFPRIYPYENVYSGSVRCSNHCLQISKVVFLRQILYCSLSLKRVPVVRPSRVDVHNQSELQHGEQGACGGLRTPWTRQVPPGSSRTVPLTDEF